MTFDKEEYWKRRNNTVPVLDKDGKPLKDENGNEVMERKPLRGQGDKPSPVGSIPNPAAVSFTNDGKLVINNRAYRRQRDSLFKKSRQLRKKHSRSKS
jgi:hypothetical protein